MSRLLFLLPTLPEPQDAGAKIRNRGLLKLLAADHEVDVLAFGMPVRPAPHGLERIVRRARVVPAPPRRSALTRVRALVSSALPDMAVRLWSPEFAAELCRWLADEDYDAVQAEGIEMARYLSLVPPERRIYDAHNAEFLLQRRFAESTTPARARLYSQLQWRRLERFERQIVRHSRMTLAVSQHDANQLLALGGPGVDVRVVPNGIDVASYPVIAPGNARDLLFLGKLDFRPNAEALRWFLSDVFPHVGDVRLFAVGGAPPEWLVRNGQHNNRVAVTGYVDDERRYLARCGVLVLPLRSGGGSRLKALIAMASGLPIVSTRMGMEGLYAEPGVHFLQLRANGSAEWVSAIRRLMEGDDLRQRLAANGRALVEQRYDWSAIKPAVCAAYAWLSQ